MGHPQGEDQYRPTPLARILHKLPHLNVSLHEVNSTFNPRSEIYIESLGILGSVPAAWLILTLLVLLIYLLTRCCDREHRPAKSISALKVTLAVIAILCCGAIGLGLYGNDDLHNGLTHLLIQGKQVENIVSELKNRTATMVSICDRMTRQLTELKDMFENPTANSTAAMILQHRVDNITATNAKASHATQDIRQIIVKVTLIPALSLGEKIEYFRWPITMGVLSVLLVLCVILLVGVARHSRCALITFSVCGLLAVISSWLLASIYLASTVALGDLCIAPDRYLASEASSLIAPEILLHYTHCETSRANPFTQRLREIKSALDTIRRDQQVLRPISLDVFRIRELDMKFNFLNSELNNAESVVSKLHTLLDCKALHSHYVEGAKGLCNIGLMGLALMLLSSVLSGLLFTILVWVDSHTWIYIRKRRDYHQVNETDQYLPPSAASQAIAARTLQRSQGSCSATAPDTPPPSYTSAMMHVRPSAPMPQPPNHHNATAMHDPLELQSLLIDGCDMRQTEAHRGAAQHMGYNRGHTLGRLPSHNTADHMSLSGKGPNNGKYATLSKQCKTLESSDFY